MALIDARLTLPRGQRYPLPPHWTKHVVNNAECLLGTLCGGAQRESHEVEGDAQPCFIQPQAMASNASKFALIALADGVVRGAPALNTVGKLEMEL